MSMNRVRTATLLLWSLFAWPFLSNAAAAAMQMSVTANPSVAAAGARVRYAVTVSNTGTLAQGVTLTAVVPAATSVAPGELSLPAYCDGSGSYVTCKAGQTLQFVGFTVAARGFVTVVYPALINNSPPPADGTKLSSAVIATIGTAKLHSSASATTAAAADSFVHVTMSALPAQVRAGGQVTYTLTFGNPGSAAVAANLTLPIPVGTSFVSASDGGTSSGGTVTWSLGTLPAGSAGRRTVVLQVPGTAAAGSQVAADAALRNPATQAVLAHASLTSGIGAAPVSTLNVRLAATPDPVAPGQRVRYALTVSNTDTSVHGVYATATVPLNSTVAPGELSLPAYCDGSGSYVTCNAGQTLKFVGFSVPAGGSVTVVYPALVSSSTPPANGTLLNSDVLVQDASTLDEYQVDVAAVAGLKTIIVAGVSSAGELFGGAGTSASAAGQLSVRGGAWARNLPPAASNAGATGNAPAAAAGSAGLAEARVIIALDDVLSGAPGNTIPGKDRWPTYLADRLRMEFGGPSNLVVVEPGVGAGAHALDLSRALARLEPVMLARNAAKYVIVLDDISESSAMHAVHGSVTLEAIIAWHRKNIEQAHALGLKVLGGTVPAFEGAESPRHGAATESIRQAVNAWIRNGKAYDGVVDFDLATCDPAHPQRLLPAYDSGDHLHPNAAGYKAMADAVDLSMFEE